MECRPGCGACCIAPSIARPFHGMPAGKAAGAHCVHLDDRYRCGLFADSRRPDCCAAFAPDTAVCGENREQALALIAELELRCLPGGVTLP